MRHDTKPPQRILVVVLAMLTMALGVELLLPRSWEIERQLNIAAPPPAVFAEVNSLKRWREWDVGHWPDADVALEYSGPEAGTGATLRWNTGTGRGVMKIMDTLRDRRVEYELLLDGGVVTLAGVIRLFPEETGTRVMWRVSSRSSGKPLERYLALFTRFQRGRDLDASLARLKARIESRK